MKALGLGFLGFSLVVSSIWFSGCGPADGGSADSFSGVLFTGYATYESAQPVAAPVSIRMTVQGSDLFDATSLECQNAKPTTGVEANGQLEVGTDGRFAIEFNSAGLALVGRPGCAARHTLSFDAVKSVRFTASIESSHESCTAFCATHESDCYAHCMTDGHELVAAVELNNAELRALPRQNDNILALDADLFFKSFADHSLISLEKIALKGSARWPDGTSVSAESLSLQLAIEGEHLFGGSTRCKGLDHHMQAIQAASATTSSTGSFQATAATGNFSAAVDAECKVLKPLWMSSVAGIHVAAQFAADQQSCAKFCAASGATDAIFCFSDCINGGRKIISTAFVSRDDLLAANPALDENGEAQWNVVLNFNSLSPRISEVAGPDLRVDGSAAARSITFQNTSFSSSSCAMVEGCIRGTGNRKLMRFDGVIQNLGDQDFVLGNPAGNPMFEFSACHGHYHLKAAMKYELLDRNTQQPIVVNSAAVIGHKQGFCMIDMRRVAGDESAKFNCAYQGLTSGWEDIYGAGLDCQWIDVTGVAPGAYLLRVTVNPDGILFEADTTNNSATVPVTIPVF